MKYIKYLIILNLLLCLNVKADVIDFDKKGKLDITFTLKDTDTKIEGIEISLYKIATLTNTSYNYEYIYDSNITCDVSLEDLTKSTLTNDINNCITDTTTKEIKTSNKDGKVTFNNLPLGLYLVKQTNKVDGYSNITPYLVILPKEQDNKFIYEITSKPKTEIINLMNLTVNKVWNTTISNKNDKNNLPDYIEVQLLDNETIIDTIKLNKENNWTYTWKDIEQKEYTVKEINIPKGYKDTYQVLDNVITITNTKTLVQTGQNYYLVLELLSTGLLLILISLLYNKRDNHE